MMRKVAILLMVGVLAGPSILLAAPPPLPTPESVLGFKPGADNKLATYDQAITYLKKLAAASSSIRLVEAGKTTSGRVMYFALISNPANLDRVDRYRDIAQRLAHPQGLTEADARRLAREGKAFVHLDGGCHATEVAGAQMTLQLAYDLVARAADPGIKDILDNDIVMLWPTMNPDGQQMVGEWLARNAGTPYAESGLPRLYQEYVGHDNNRDAYMLNMIESRVMEHFWRQWEPNIIYVFHQSSPFPTRIWLPPFSEPIAPDAPPVVSREINMIGMAIAKSLEERGQVGATHMGLAFDAWYPGYADYAPVFKNIPAFWTETAGSMAAPREYTPADFPEDYRDLRPQSLYASPWAGGWWRLGDAVAYNETAAIATLEFAAKYRESLLYNRYRAGRDQIEAGRKTAPYAYMIPQDQRDPVAAVELLRRLAFGGVRVWQLTSPVTVEKTTYPSGTWVVPADQEFGAMARELLSVQKYPDLRQFPGGPPLRPYDAAGWTLPLQMGVNVASLMSPISDSMRATMKVLGEAPAPTAKPTAYNMSAATDPAPFDSVPGIGFNSNATAAAIVPRAGTISGSGATLAVDPAQNNAFRAITRAWKLGAGVQVVNGAAGSGGRYLITGLPEAAQVDIVTSLALTAERTSAAGLVIRKPRIGLYQPWSGSMDEGWTRWLLEQYGFDVITLHPEDFKTPLRDKVDTLILADDARIPLEGGVASGARGEMGPPASTSAGGPAGGRGQSGRGGAGRSVRPEYAYALTAADLRGFEQFVRDGGTLICFNSASRFAIQQFKLPVRNLSEGLKPEEFFLRGSIVSVKTDTTHPVMAGMPETAAVFVDGSPVFEPQVGFKGTILAKYADIGSPLESGYLIGEKYLQGRAAALDVELGRGHVVLIGFRPQWRGQPHATFRVVFNAAMYVR
ncbi:MAG: M14 metallopeptidase family protein [Acidobacteriota bacterium]